MLSRGKMNTFKNIFERQTMAERRSSKSAVTRERILSGALTLFAEKGYAQTTIREIVTGARDAPRPPVSEALATLFYALHLVLLLFWLQDSSPGQRATHQSIDFGEEMLGRLRLILRLPWAADGLTKLSGILAPVL